MRNMSWPKTALQSALALGILTGGTIISYATGDYSSRYRYQDEDVFQYLQSKEILPFEEVLKIARKHIKGVIIETEFELEYGVPVYEIKYIDAKGRVLEIYINAKTGKILNEEVK